MTCDRCDQPASVFFTQIVGDNIKKVNLCQDCAQSQKVTDPTGFALADLLNDVGSDSKLPRPKPKRGGVSCPTCGFAEGDFKKTGRLGCPECYGVFRDQLLAALPSMHRGSEHTGKIPSHFDFPAGGGAELLDSLQQRLTRAVDSEDFEAAARVRDLIHRLTESDGATGS